MEYKITQELHHWRTEEKIKWFGYGEWVEEADSVTLEYRGYKALIYRIMTRESEQVDRYSGGYLCGYIRIPKDHPYFESPWEEIFITFDCHGGITFSECHEEHWIGFDCVHLNDLNPGLEALKREIEGNSKSPIFQIPEQYKNHPIFNKTYRNMQFCIDQCISLINQAIAAQTLSVHEEKDS